jgi:predicted N-acetyltransferase YhbS
MIIKNATAGDIAQLTTLWQQAFGDTSEFIRGFFETGFSPERCMLAEENGILLGALYWFDCQWESKKIAYLYAVSTDEAHRGKGICTALMDATHNHLQKENYDGCILVPAEEHLFRFYEKLGYSPCCPMSAVTFEKAEPPLELTALSPQDYWFMRLVFLPKNGIVQNIDSLDFYSTYGSFYRFDGGIFCAAIDGKELYIQEFFGNKSKISHIGAALGCESIHIRLPGKTNHAMYHSLTDDTVLPEYFGIPLD